MNNAYFYSPLKLCNMQLSSRDIEIKYFSEFKNPEMVLAQLTKEPGNYPSWLDEHIPVEELTAIFEDHRIEHGVAPGGIYMAGKGIVGIGGFHYLEETGLYEVVCYIAPLYKKYTSTVINYLTLLAFDGLKMDKICARAIPGTSLDSCFAGSGFVFSGERMFMREGDEEIWNYYEMEDESSFVSSDNKKILSDYDWDVLF